MILPRTVADVIDQHVTLELESLDHVSLDRRVHRDGQPIRLPTHALARFHRMEGCHRDTVTERGDRVTLCHALTPQAGEYTECSLPPHMLTPLRGESMPPNR